MRYIVYLVLAVVFISCSKENSDSFYPYPNNSIADTVWALQVPTGSEVFKLLDELRPAPQTANFNGQAGTMVNFHEGLQVKINPNALHFLNGGICTTNVQLDVVQVRQKGDLVRLARPTTSFGRILHSAGTFLIRATSNGQELKMAPGERIMIKFKTPLNNQAMSLFYGEQVSNNPGANTGYTWVPSLDSSTINTYQHQDSSGISRGYEIFSRRLHWLSAASYLDTTQVQSSRLDVLLPLNFTNVNTLVFAVFKQENIVVQLNADYQTRSFFYQKLPSGKPVTIVSLSKRGNDLYLASFDLTTAGNQPVSLSPVIRSKPMVEQFLQNL